MENPVPAMIEALTLEIAAIRKSGGTTQLELTGGERTGQAEERWLYRFVVTEELTLRDDTPVKLLAGGDSTTGIVVSFQDGILLVALDRDLGPKIPLARLVTDDAFLLERLVERLQQVEAGEAGFNRGAAARALGLQAPSIGDADPSAQILGDGRLNPDQIRALRRALGSDMTLLWGPPGTGKTVTLARIAEGFYRMGRSVLLVSNTNIAVDTLLEKVAECLADEPGFDQGLVLRLGPVVKPELRQRFGAQVVLEEVLARLGGHLTEEKNALSARAAEVQAALADADQTLAFYGRLRQGEADLAALKQRRADLEDERSGQTRESARWSATVRQLSERLKEAQQTGPLLRFLRRLNPEQLRKQLSEAERALQDAQDRLQAVGAEKDSVLAAIQALTEELRQLQEKMRDLPTEEEVLGRREKLVREREEIRNRLEAIAAELAGLEGRVLSNCRILATTVYRTYLGKGLERRFDAVVVDEASMLMPPLVYYAAGLTRTAVTVGGDFRQLPPIVLSDEPQALEWLKRDVFEIAKIPESLALQRPPGHLVSLGVQYRMHEDICGVVNELFYPDRPLRTAEPAGRSSKSFPFSEASLLYVDTSPFQPWAAYRTGTYSRYNLWHALMVRNLVSRLDSAGFLPREDETNDDLGVVSPYSAQARLIQAMLRERWGARVAGAAATVHRFQGNEKSLMLLDLTDSTGTPLGQFLKGTQLSQESVRLLNVAVSRARRHVVLIGNMEFLRAKAPRNGYLQRLLDLFYRNGRELDAGGLVPHPNTEDLSHLLTSPLPHRIEQESDILFVHEGTFYSAFSQDLLQARESVILLSPFATPRGTGRWVEIFRQLLARGVKVHVVTRPPGDSGAASKEEVAELVAALRRLGVVVDLRARMHEKIACIDGRIL